MPKISDLAKEARMNRRKKETAPVVAIPDSDPVVETAINEMLNKVKLPLDKTDSLLVESAKNLILQKFAHGFHQLVAIGIDRFGTEFTGLQLDCPIGQTSICAEGALVAKAAEAKAELVTVVTAHQKRAEEGGEVHIVSPCPNCIVRLMHVFPKVNVIVYRNGELQKLPIRVLLPLPYKRRKRPNGGERCGEAFPT